MVGNLKGLLKRRNSKLPESKELSGPLARQKVQEILDSQIRELEKIINANTQFKRDFNINRGFLKAHEIKKLRTIQKKLKDALK